MADSLLYAGSHNDRSTPAGWANPNNALGAPDGNSAEAVAGETGDIDFYNYGFAIPADSTIDIITISPTTSQSSGSAMTGTKTAQFYKDAANRTDAIGAAGTFPTLTVLAPAITAADVNAAAFGVSFSDLAVDVGEWVRIDNVTIRISYTEPTDTERAADKAPTPTIAAKNLYVNRVARISDKDVDRQIQELIDKNKQLVDIVIKLVEGK